MSKKKKTTKKKKTPVKDVNPLESLLKKANEERSEYFESLQQLLNIENLEVKTDITHPVMFAKMQSHGRTLEKLGLEKTAKTWNKLIRYILTNNISKSRKGRKEFVEALKSSQQSLIPENPNNLITGGSL